MAGSPWIWVGLAPGVGQGRALEQILGGPGHANAKLRAPALLAQHLDAVAVLVGDALHDGQPDTRAVGARREERVEEAQLRLRIETDALVAHAQHDRPAGALLDGHA